jgi:hypothetical protein
LASLTLTGGNTRRSCFVNSALLEGFAFTKNSPPQNIHIIEERLQINRKDVLSHYRKNYQAVQSPVGAKDW